MIKLFASFDDGSKLDIKTANIIGDIETTFFIPVNWQKYNTYKGDEPLSQQDIYDLSKKFSIGSHGINHELLTRVDDSTQNREIIDSRKYWKDNRFKVESFCYPRGYYTTEIKNKVRDAGYKWARTVRIGELQPAQDQYETHTTVHVGYDRKEYGTDWLTYAKAKIKESIKRANDGEDIIYHFWGHSAEIDKYNQWDRFKEFINELRVLR